MTIQPDAKVVQRYPGGQADLKPSQRVGALPVQTEGMVEFGVYALHNLSGSGQPTAQALGPRMAAVPFWGADYPGPIMAVPVLVPLLPLEPLVHNVVAISWGAHRGHSGVGKLPEGEEVFRQCLVFGAGWSEAEAALGKKFAAASLEGLKIDEGMCLADLHAGADYRAHLAAVMTKRAVQKITG